MLGEPVLGEPSNEVGRASTKPLGEPVLSRWASHSTTVDACFKAAPWRYGASARARSLHLHGASTGVPTFLQVPARHCACSARARSAHLVTSASSARARSALHPLHGASSAPGCQLSYKCPLGTGVPARHVPARHCLCPLGTCPLGTSSY